MTKWPFWIRLVVMITLAVIIAWVCAYVALYFMFKESTMRRMEEAVRTMEEETDNPPTVPSEWGWDKMSVEEKLEILQVLRQQLAEDFPFIAKDRKQRVQDQMDRVEVKLIQARQLP